MNLNLDEESIRSIVRDVLGKMNGSAAAAPRVRSENGIFPDGATAAAAAREGYAQLCKGGIAARREVVDIVKSMTVSNAKQWGAFEYEETKIGRLEDKIGKLEIVKLVPGVEWIAPDAYSGDNGIMLEEYAPYGVIGAITPVTHSIPTIAGNIINMVAAGNAVVFNPHPGGVKSAVMAISAFNAEIERRLGIRNLICCVGNPTLESFDAICKSGDVAIMCITGGPGVVKAAMKSGKKSICAGPGNPPVIVDETANPRKAASDIIAGGAFDNNLLCIGEKEIFVTERAASNFMRELENCGAERLSPSALDRLTCKVFESKNGGYALKRALVGKDPQVLARAAGANVSAKTKMLFAETGAPVRGRRTDDADGSRSGGQKFRGGRRSSRESRAQLPPQRDNPFARRHPHDGDGEGSEHDALRQKRPVNRRPRARRRGIPLLLHRDRNRRGHIQSQDVHAPPQVRNGGKSQHILKCKSPKSSGTW